MTNQEYWAQLSESATGLFSLGEIGIRQWRRFLCACYRRIDELVPHSDTRQVVETAEKFIDGRVGPDELARVCRDADRAADDAWQNVVLRKSPGSWTWPLSDEVDAVWVHYLVCSAAKETVQPELRPTILPDTAASVRAWAFARRNLRDAGFEVVSESARDLVQKEWDRLSTAEQEAQIQLLLQFVRES